MAGRAENESPKLVNSLPRRPSSLAISGRHRVAISGRHRVAISGRHRRGNHGTPHDTHMSTRISPRYRHARTRWLGFKRYVRARATETASEWKGANHAHATDSRRRLPRG